MPAFQDTQRIRAGGRHNAASCIGGSADNQAYALYSYCWQRQRPVDSVVDTEVRGIESCIWFECDVDAIEAETRLVHNARAESMRFTEREDLALSSASVPEARNSLSTLGRRFCTTFSL